MKYRSLNSESQSAAFILCNSEPEVSEKVVRILPPIPQVGFKHLVSQFCEIKPLKLYKEAEWET